MHGIRASPFKSAYVAAKHGLEGLSKVTALKGGRHGVTSNCINPGYVRTPLVEKQIADQARVHGIPESEVLPKIMLTESSIKRLVEPAEVASLAPGFFRAPRGLLDAAPLYPESVVAEWAERMPQLVVHEVPDVNHYTIVMTAEGAGSVVPMIRTRLAAMEMKEGAS